MVDRRGRLDEANMVRSMSLLDFGPGRRSGRQQLKFRRVEMRGQIEQHFDALGPFGMGIAWKVLQVCLIDDDGAGFHKNRLTSKRRPCKTGCQFAANLAKPRKIT
jgi:hypothetical protein